ncbi:transporter [Trypanosoma theileri]|uniref:Transporter n=1 Tax=Trypanosoma theileri TaxID=67003 RepID=A0A1X0P442_9TRYP|nr:transporter [Trypanosoma theileri]ORC91704.1 transporter [Trypanosoma theileri]
MSSVVSLARDWATALHIPNILQGLTGGMRITLVPIFARQLGSSDALLGVIIGSAGVSKVFLDIVFGFATSAYGCRMIMMAGMVVNLLGIIVAVLAQSPFHLIFASLLWGAGIGAFFVSRHVFIAKAVPRNIRGRLMSMIGGEIRWCSFAGPALGGILVDYSNVRLAVLLMFPMALGCACVVSASEKIREVDAQKQDSEESTSISKDLNAMMTAFWRYWDVLIRVGVYSFNIISLRQGRGMLLTLAAMNMGLSASMVGTVLSLSYVVDATFFFLGGYIMDHFGRKYAAIPTTINLGIAFLLLSHSNNFTSLIFTAFYFGLADSTGAGILMTLTADHSPPSGGAPFMGLMRTMQDSGQVFGPIICGLLVQHVSFSWACYVMAILGLLNGVWACIMIPEKSCSQEEEEQSRAAAAMEEAVSLTKIDMKAKKTDDAGDSEVVVMDISVKE